MLLAMPKGSYENDDQNIVFNCSHTYLFTLSISPMFKDIQRHPSVLVKFDFNQVGFVFLFVFGHGKVGHDMRMFNYQWDNHGKRTSNNPINPVHRILNTPWKPWFRIENWIYYIYIYLGSHMIIWRFSLFGERAQFGAPLLHVVD